MADDAGDEPAPGASDLDPALIARLEAWFGAPTKAVEPAPPPPPPLPRPDAAQDEQHARRRRAALEAAGRSALKRAIEERGREHAAMVNPLPPMTLTPERPPNRFDLSRWRLLRFEAGEAAPPDDIWDALAERTPQALLRDLHRPVFYFDQIELEQTELIPASSLHAASEVQAVLARDYRWRPKTPELALARDELRALRRRLRNDRWGDAPAEIARLRAGETPQAPEREPTTEELIALFEPPR